jgi:predicted enzyme related to lactoylglutathione lyase
MTDSHGQFCWYELMTTDTDKAGAFYKAVLGWTVQDAGHPTMAYTMIKVGEQGIGGMMVLPEAAAKNGARPGWMGYVWVRDLEAAVDSLKAAGGTVHRPIDTIPHIGRFAVVSDPQGAAFILFRSFTDEQAPPVVPGTPGHTGWHELQATDTTAAMGFYSSQYGWTKGEGFDMGGPVGVYQLFATGDMPNGGIFQKMPEAPHPFWLFYFNVDAADAALERVKEAGGQVLMGPAEVPGGSWISQCIDPQGAMFALVAPKR